MDTQKKIKLVVSDIDGVWTDGGLYYDEQGRQIKKFNVKDGAAVKLLKTVGIPVCIITAKESDMVVRRAKEVGVEYIYQGVEKKITCITELINNLNINFSEVAYIGDDFNDVPVLRKCLISAVPKDASPVIKKEAKWALKKRGGNGVFREFAEKILMRQELLDIACERMINSLEDPQSTDGTD